MFDNVQIWLKYSILGIVYKNVSNFKKWSYKEPRYECNTPKCYKKITCTSILGILSPLGFSNHTNEPNNDQNRTFKHSVCRWLYAGRSLEELCEIVVDIGIDSIELLNPKILNYQVLWTHLRNNKLSTLKFNRRIW